MKTMNKIFLTVLSAIIVLSVQSTSFASLHQSQVANVSSINSVFSYRDPELLAIYLQKKAQQENDKKNNSSSNEEKLIEPPIIFSIYLNNDTFYDKDDSEKYKKRIDIGFTSHNRERNFIFDKERPPYLIIDNGESVEQLYFKKFKFDNPYWISFALNHDEIAQIKNAKKIIVVLPELNDNIFVVNERKAKIEKKSYKKDMSITEQSFDLPEETIDEWKTVLADV